MPNPSILEMESEEREKIVDISEIELEIGKLLTERRKIDEKIEFLRETRDSSRFFHVSE